MSGQQWADAAAGMGAWFQGKGPEYERNQRLDEIAKNKSLAELDIQRREALAQDLGGAAVLIKNGRPGEAGALLTERLGLIGQLNGDPYHTEGFINQINEAVSSGDPALMEELKAEAAVLEERLVRGGALKADPKTALGANKNQFGPGDTVKDSEGNLFHTTTRRNPATGAVEGVLTPVLPSGPQEPVGPVSMTNSMGLSRAELVAMEGQIAGAKATGAGEATGKTTRRNEAMDLGMTAARSVPVLKRSIFLMNDLGRAVETGGVDAWMNRVKQAFGVEGADEAELTANLGKNVLAQLKPIFGAQFTVKEGEELKRIEAGFGKSTAGNRRLLEQTLQIAERVAKRGIRAANSGTSPDQFTADEIQSELDFELADQQMYMSPVLGREVSNEDIMSTAKMRGITPLEVRKTLGITGGED